MDCFVASLLAMTGQCTLRAPCYGRLVMLVVSPGVRIVSRAHNSPAANGLRGSMISSTQNHSAERNGSAALRRSSTLQLGFRTSAASMSARDRPLRCRLRAATNPNRPMATHSVRKPIRRLMRNACDAERISHDDGAPAAIDLLTRAGTPLANSARLPIEPITKPGQSSIEYGR